MARVQISIDETEAERVQKVLAGIEGGARTAMHNALDRAMSKVRTETTRAISGVYAITQQNLRSATNIKSRIRIDGLLSGGEVVGEIEFAGNKIPLYRYNVNPRIPRRSQEITQILNGSAQWMTVRKSVPVSAAIKRDSPRTYSESAFIARMKSGHVGVFERVGEASGPQKIRERMGLATAQMAKNAVVLEDVERQAQETMTKRLEHEMTRILNGFR